MSLVEELKNLGESMMMGRQIGKTTVIIEAAKKIGATIICANQIQAKQIKLLHDIPTITLSRDIRGTKGPYLADHYTTESIAFQAANEIEKLKNDLDREKLITRFGNEMQTANIALIKDLAKVKEFANNKYLEGVESTTDFRGGYAAALKDLKLLLESK